MDAKELRRNAVICERLAQGAVPFTVSQELLQLADQFEAEAIARLCNEDPRRRKIALRNGH